MSKLQNRLLYWILDPGPAPLTANPLLKLWVKVKAAFKRKSP